LAEIFRQTHRQPKML